MDQKKIGAFLKELRKEKQMTQEQLAEILGVTNRSISRWENGVNMPDFDLVIEIANYYNVNIEEILDGERKSEMIDRKTEQILLKVADYESNEKQSFSKRVCGLFIAAILAFVLYGVLNFTGLDTKDGYEQIASYAMGIVGGALLVGALYTSGYMAKIQAFKKRILYKSGKSSDEVQNRKGIKGNTVFWTVLSITLLAAGVAFGIVAILGHTAAYSASISCLCAGTVWTVTIIQERRKR